MPWTVAHWAPLSMEISSAGLGSHSLLQRIFSTFLIEPRSPALQADSLPSEPPGKPLLSSGTHTHTHTHTHTYVCMYVCISQTGCFKQEKFILHSSGSWKVKAQVANKVDFILKPLVLASIRLPPHSFLLTWPFCSTCRWRQIAFSLNSHDPIELGPTHMI